MSARALTGAGNVSRAAVASGVGASLTLAKPANTSAGDYLVCVLYARGDTTGAPVPTPAGWSLVPATMPSAGIGQVNVFYRKITNPATEPATYTFTPTGGNRKVATLFRVTGAHRSRFLLAVSASDITYGGATNTAVVAPDVPMRDSLGLTIIGTNYSAPLVPPTASQVTDELGSSVVDVAGTSTGSGETVLYVLQNAIPTRDALGVNHASMSVSPSSGLAYMLIIGSEGVPPEMSLGADPSVEAGVVARVNAKVVAGVADWLDWRIVGETPPEFNVAPDGTYVTFRGVHALKAKDYVFEVRGRDTSEPTVLWSDYSRLTVTVRAHQAWSRASDGNPLVMYAPKMWTRVENSMARPGEVYVPGGITVSQWLAKSTFYAAHRGGGDEFPEHTMEAYQGAVSGGLDAIEVSVRVTQDGEMVCFHDDTLDRTTNSTGPIAERTYQDLYDNVRVERSAILGPAMPGARIPRVVDVLRQFAGKKIILLEGKSGAVHTRLYSELDKYADSGVVLGDWFIQKQFYQGGTWTKDAAHARGIKVWGYMGEETTDAQLAVEDYRVDLWGVPDQMPLARKAEIVKRGKPVICWEVHRRAQVEEHQSIGLRGQMSSSAIYVQSPVQRAVFDTFASRRKAPGDMWSANIAVDNLALTFDGKGGANHKFPDPICATVMGSLCPVRDGAVVSMQMSWTQNPTSGASGVAFGCRNDEIFRPAGGFVNKVGGYYLSVTSAQRSATLYRYDPGAWAPVALGTILLDLPAGTPLQVTVTITPAGPVATVAGMELSSTDRTYSGKYFHIAQGNNNTLTTFSKISV